MAKLWDKEIRPVLRKAAPGRTEYRWSSIVRYFPKVGRVAFGFNARCYALAIYTCAPDGVAILSGLTYLVEGITFPGSTNKCIYVWFLQSAPDAYILSKGASLTPCSGAALLDAAIVTSNNAGYDGRILLHADPSGGQALIDYYTSFGLQQLVGDIPVGITSKQNDGRYFVADEAIAQFVIRRHKRYR